MFVKNFLRSVTCRKFGFLSSTNFDMSSVAIENSNGDSFSYDQLRNDSIFLHEEFVSNLSDDCEHVGFLFPPSYNYAAMSISLWMGKKCAVPISAKSPLKEIEYVLEDSDVSTFFYDPEEFETHLTPLIEKLDGTVDFIPIPKFSPSSVITDSDVSPIKFSGDDKSLIFYTSGTTGRPKAVLHSQHSFESQMRTLCDNWEISSDDVCLHVLPLHHVHGVVNALFSTLYAGGKVIFSSPFNAEVVWETFREKGVTLFHAVPTIYTMLLSHADHVISTSEDDEISSNYFTDCCNSIRLMVSGSAPLPTSVFKRWADLTSHTLLERYGMTEFGMGLSNPLDTVSDRIEGTVGYAMGNMDVKICKIENDGQQESNNIGEIFVRGDHMFTEYYGRQEDTKESFSSDGYFMTGDVAELDPKTGRFKILGRMSQDIIKSAGYKISALDIEREVCVHPNVMEVVVLGVEDEVLGEAVAAVLVLKDEKEFSKIEMTRFLKQRLSQYKIPRHYLIVNEIPKNQMGKVNKQEIKKILF